MPILTVIILAFNEELHMARCMRHLAALDANVIVVDSYSTDRTCEIARAEGAQVLQHKFVNHAKQFQWCLDHAEIATPWVMRLDADEMLDDELIAEIKEKLGRLPAEIAGVNLKRRHIFMGRWIRHGGRFPLVLLRIWRRGQGRIEDRWMDEHMVVWGGQTITFDHNFSDVNLNDLTFFTAKHNAYATREAIDVLNRKYGLSRLDEDLNTGSSSVQAAAKRWFKENFYNRLPLWAGPFAYFSFRYVFQLGFLDRREGLIYHFLQGFWYRFLVAAKLVEFEKLLETAVERDQRIQIIERATGHRLTQSLDEKIAP